MNTFVGEKEATGTMIPLLLMHKCKVAASQQPSRNDKYVAEYFMLVFFFWY